MPTLTGEIMGLWRRNQQQSDTPHNQSAEDPVVSRAYTGQGNLLTLANLRAAITVTTGDYEGITATVEAGQSQINKLVIDVSNGLSITGQRVVPDLIKDLRSLSFWRKVFQPRQSVITILEEHRVPECTIHITAPECTDLRLEEYYGTLQADGTYGSLFASAEYGAVLQVNRTKDVTLDLGTESSIRVNEVDGDCYADLGYQSQLSINGGSLYNCIVNADTSSKATITALCHGTATYNGGYESRFHLGRLTGTLRATTDSSAQLQIYCNNAQLLDINAGYDSRTRVIGRAAQVHLDLDGHTEAILQEVVDQLIVRAGYECTVHTQTGTGVALVDIEMDGEAKLELAGSIREGRIELGYNSVLVIGELTGRVDTHFDGSVKLITGYFRERT